MPSLGGTGAQEKNARICLRFCDGIFQELQPLRACIILGLLGSLKLLFQFKGPFFPLEQLGKVTLELINAAFFFPQFILAKEKVFFAIAGSRLAASCSGFPGAG
jgi:hypothetical protein